jgi:hypothetical protein
VEDLDADMDMNSSWEMIRQNSSQNLGYYEIKEHKPISMKVAQND